MSEVVLCELCGEPMPAGEEMFNYHGYSGPCPKPPKQKPPSDNPPSSGEYTHDEAMQDIRRAHARWTDQDLYNAYLCGCEDDCLPEPMSETMFLAQFTGGK